MSNVANLMNITANSKFLTDAALCPADALSAESETTVIVPGNESALTISDCLFDSWISRFRS